MSYCKHPCQQTWLDSKMYSVPTALPKNSFLHLNFFCLLDENCLMKSSEFQSDTLLSFPQSLLPETAPKVWYQTWHPAPEFFQSHEN